MGINEVGGVTQSQLSVTVSDGNSEVNLFMISLQVFQQLRNLNHTLPYFHNLRRLHPQRSSSFPSCTWPLQYYHNPQLCWHFLFTTDGIQHEGQGRDGVTMATDPAMVICLPACLDLKEQRAPLICRF